MAQAGGVLDVSQDLQVLGKVLSSGGTTIGGIGYARGTGSGSSVTQITNRSTAVICNGLSGQITTINTSLAAEAAAAFVVSNSAVEINDVVVVSQQSGAVGAMTLTTVSTVTNGSFTINVTNNNAAGGTAETGALILNFVVIKGTKT